jgi:hypothetical protein
MIAAPASAASEDDRRHAVEKDVVDPVEPVFDQKRGPYCDSIGDFAGGNQKNADNNCANCDEVTAFLPPETRGHGALEAN